MADYCTITDVRGWIPAGGTIDDQANMPPTSLTVSGWITSFSAAIDSLLGASGGANETEWRRILLGRELAYQVMAVRTNNAVNDPLYLGWHEEFVAFISPSAAEAAASITVPASSYTMNAPDVPDSSVNPVFTRDQAHEW